MTSEFSPYKINSQRNFYYELLPNFTSSSLESIVKDIKTSFSPYKDASGKLNITHNTPDPLERDVWNISNLNTPPLNFLDVNISNAIKNANKVFNFDLDTILELKYFEYHQNSQTNLDWHIDIGHEEYSLRKLSFSLIVSDENEYEGGDLEVWLDSTHHQKIPKLQGGIVFFPSFLLHRVTKITKGTRRVIVGFIGGSPYR